MPPKASLLEEKSQKISNAGISTKKEPCLLCSCSLKAERESLAESCSSALGLESKFTENLIIQVLKWSDKLNFVQ